MEERRGADVSPLLSTSLQSDELVSSFGCELWDEQRCELGEIQRREELSWNNVPSEILFIFSRVKLSIRSIAPMHNLFTDSEQSDQTRSFAAFFGTKEGFFFFHIFRENPSLTLPYPLFIRRGERQLGSRYDH